ncbi:MAG TPA: L,D-transpeptidase [Candidatus Sulfopaludibacter sp.]|nr:L,D-transpeptidase [Candidatus Sulfopaludibacter sp.]
MSARWVTIALFPALLASAQSHKTARGSASRIAPSFNVGEISNPQQQPLSEGATGPAVVRAQILLARAHFSCGQIDGVFGTNLKRTVTAFQQDRHLPESNSVDEATWSALNADTAPLVTQYTVTDDDEKGPFVTLPNDLMEQAKLPYMGYASPLDELSERFHASPDLLKRMNPGADFTSAGQTLTVPNVMVMPPPGPAAQVVVTKSESSVRAYDKEGHLLSFYVATLGSSHDPLPLGQWTIKGQKKDPSFHYNSSLFWDAATTTDRATIKPGPRNPVGSVWIDLSKEHYGIHGTPDPALIGHVTSHGCIRLTNWDALDLASLVKPGTPAILKE